MSKRVLLPLWSLALLLWAGVGYGMVALDVGAIPDTAHPLRVAFYLIAIAAPALLFLPLSRLIGLRTWGYEACCYWTGLILLLTFVSPESAGLPGYLLCILLFFGAVSSVLLPVGYAIGFKLLTLRVHRRDTGRARREAYLGALFVALSAAMNVGGFYNALNALLLGLILLIVESFALASKPGAGYD